MTLFAGKYRVESARKLGWNYQRRGCYFVTLCTYDRKPLFGDWVNGQFLLNDGSFYSAISLSAGSLSVIIRAFKSAATKRLHETGRKGRIWQPGFHDRIVRNESELRLIREYIKDHVFRRQARTVGT